MANCIVSELAVKKLKTDADGVVTFAIKANITRKIDEFDDEDDVIVEIQGLDSDGFERTTVYLEGIIPAGEMKNLSTKQEYYDVDFDDIVCWRQK